MYRSFLVRLWHDDDTERDIGWQAEVRQIQSNERWTFDSREALLAFFRQRMDDTDTPSRQRV